MAYKKYRKELKIKLQELVNSEFDYPAPNVPYILIALDEQSGYNVVTNAPNREELVTALENTLNIVKTGETVN